MQIKSLAIVAGTTALGLALLIPSRAQGPMFDVVKVNLPYPVTVGDKTIQPGDYMIKELPSQDKSRVLLIYGDNGMKFEVSAMTIPAYDPQTLDKSEVTLHHIGDDYYFDKVWIQGKNYGYEFPMPRNLKEREKEQAAVSVPATYQAPQETPVTTTENTPPPAQESAVTPAPAPVAAAPEPAPAQSEIAQNTTPATPEVSSNNEANEANREQLPHTSAGWLMMLLSGGTLSGAGLMLRRKS